MEALKHALQTTPLFYINRDIERAVGFDLATPGFFIISNYTPFGKQLAEKYSNIFLIQEDRLLDTWELLEHEKTKEFTVRSSQFGVLVFKNTERIESICKKNNWRLLNPPAALADTVEEKISQVEWLGELTKYLPPHKIILCKDILWTGTPFILQFNRAHTGAGTMLITSIKQIEHLQQLYPNRPVRVTDHIVGPALTNNNVVSKQKILLGNINYQITGLAPFTDNPFATIGNDWKLAHELLSPEQKEQYREIAEAVGNKLRADGWKGLFGIDVIMDEKTGKLYLIEINARQPASVAFESRLQTTDYRLQQQSSVDRSLLTVFEAHLASVFDLDLSEYSLVEINNGAQVIVRNNEQLTINNEQCERLAQSLGKEFTVIPYMNDKPAAERLRIQSSAGIMKKHGVLNAVGEKILEIIQTV